MGFVYVVCTNRYCDFEQRIRIVSEDEAEKMRRRGEHVSPGVPRTCPKCGQPLRTRE